MDYKLINVLGDGACFFRSVSNSLSENFVYHDRKQDQDVITLKQTILQYLIKNPSNYVYCPYPKDIYTKQLLQRGYWGGEFEAFILSRAIPCNIIIISKILRNPQEFIVDQSLKTIYIYYQPGHYQSVMMQGTKTILDQQQFDESISINHQNTKLRIVLLFQIVGFYFMYRNKEMLLKITSILF